MGEGRAASRAWRGRGFQYHSPGAVVQDHATAGGLGDQTRGREGANAAEQEAKAGNKFTCTVQFGGDNPGEKVVDITVRNDSGEYEVGTPRDR